MAGMSGNMHASLVVREVYIFVLTSLDRGTENTRFLVCYKIVKIMHSYVSYTTVVYMKSPISTKLSTLTPLSAFADFSVFFEFLHVSSEYSYFLQFT